MIDNQPDGSSKFTTTLPETLKQNLEEISSKTGLSQSEIVRRGTLEELRKLEER